MDSKMRKARREKKRNKGDVWDRRALDMNDSEVEEKS